MTWGEVRKQIEPFVRRYYDLTPGTLISDDPEGCLVTLCEECLEALGGAIQDHTEVDLLPRAGSIDTDLEPFTLCDICLRQEWDQYPILSGEIALADTIIALHTADWSAYR